MSNAWGTAQTVPGFAAHAHGQVDKCGKKGPVLGGIFTVTRIAEIHAAIICFFSASRLRTIRQTFLA